MVKPTVLDNPSHTVAKAVAMPSQAAVAGQIQVGKVGHILLMTALRSKNLLTAEGPYRAKRAHWGTVRVATKAAICDIAAAGDMDAAASRVGCRVNFFDQLLVREKQFWLGTLNDPKGPDPPRGGVVMGCCRNDFFVLVNASAPQEKQDENDATIDKRISTSCNAKETNRRCGMMRKYNIVEGCVVAFNKQNISSSSFLPSSVCCLFRVILSHTMRR